MLLSEQRCASGAGTSSTAPDARSHSLHGCNPYRKPSRRLSYHQIGSAPGGVSRRASIVIRASSSGDDGIFNPEEDFPRLFSESKLFQSEVVMKEFGELMKTFQDLSSLNPKFWSFDVAGKRVYLEQMEAWCERMRVFNMRLKLSDDAAATKYLSLLNRQLLEAGMNLDSLYDGAAVQTKALMELTEMEERAMSNPEEVAKVRMFIKAQTMPAIDVKELGQDPEIMQMLSDPQAFVVVKDILDNSSNSSKWMDDPKHGPLARRIWALLAKKKMQQDG